MSYCAIHLRRHGPRSTQQWRRTGRRRRADGRNRRAVACPPPTARRAGRRTETARLVRPGGRQWRRAAIATKIRTVQTGSPRLADPVEHAIKFIKHGYVLPKLRRNRNSGAHFHLLKCTFRIRQPVGLDFSATDPAWTEGVPPYLDAPEIHAGFHRDSWAAGPWGQPGPQLLELIRRAPERFARAPGLPGRTPETQSCQVPQWGRSGPAPQPMGGVSAAPGLVTPSTMPPGPG
jgi:hypothetical protein